MYYYVLKNSKCMVKSIYKLEPNMVVSYADHIHPGEIYIDIIKKEYNAIDEPKRFITDFLSRFYIDYECDEIIHYPSRLDIINKNGHYKYTIIIRNAKCVILENGRPKNQIDYVNDLVDFEFRNAKSKHIDFVDDHHFYAVLKEEFEELVDETDHMGVLLNAMWRVIKKDKPIEVDTLMDVAKKAVIEASQIAAVCEKYKYSNNIPILPL